MHINSVSFLRAAFLKFKRNGIFRWRIAFMVCLAMIGNTAIAQSACQVRIFSPDEENAIAAIVRDINGISSINHEIAAKSRATLVRLVLTRWELLGTAAPDISDGTLVTNLLDLAANTSGETASALERSCSQVNELITAETIPVPALNMVSHEVGSAGTIAGLNGAKNSKLYFKVNVPHGITDLVIQTNGAEGDADLYVSQGARPTKNAAQCYSMGFGLNEQCRFDTPDGGAYYILLNGYADYSDLTLKVSWRGRGTPLAEILTGHLYDSAVQGIQYRSCNSLNAVDCIEGITGLRGEFNYTAGQQIEFKLGGLRIGVAQGQELVTPDKLANGDAGVALQIAQLLQSLDADQDPSNGIVIPESVRSLAVGAYPGGQDVRFVNNSQVLSKLAPGRALVSMEQVSAHAQGASLLDVMLANGSGVIPKAILGTNMYPTTGKINYESLNRNVHARLRLALFQRRMMEDKGLITILQNRGASVREVENDVKAWMNRIEIAKNTGDSLMALGATLHKKDVATSVEALGSFVALGNKFIPADKDALSDAEVESFKAATLALAGVGISDIAGNMDSKKLLMASLEALKARSSASDSPIQKRFIESVQFGFECLNLYFGRFNNYEIRDPIYQCFASGAELVAKGIVESVGAGYLMLSAPMTEARGAAYDFMLAYYQSAGNRDYLREKYGINFTGPFYDARKMLGLDFDPAILLMSNVAMTGEVAAQAVKIYAYQQMVSRWMAEIEDETAFYAHAFNLKYSGLLDLKATGIENGSVVPAGTAVDFEATFKNMTAGNYTVRSINWVASGVGSPTVVAAGTRANVRFHSAGTYRVAAHAEVLLPDGQTYFMVDTFTVVVNDATPVPTLTLAATPGNGYVDLSWNAIPGATSYAVHMTAGTVGPEGPPLYATTSATQFRVSGLQNGTLHRFTVSAFKSGQVIAGSGLVSATPAASGDADIFGSIVQLSVNTSLIGRKLVGDGTEFFIGDSTVVTAEVDFDNNGVVFVYKKNGNFAAGDQKGFNGYLIEFPDSNFILKNVWINNHLTSLSGMAENHVWVDGNIAYLNVAGLRYRVGDVLRVEFQIEKKNRDLIAGRYLPIEGGSVIRDTVNNLEWQRCSVGQTWNGANQHCDGTATKYEWALAKQLVTANGFRIPTIDELLTLVHCSSGESQPHGPLPASKLCGGASARPTIVGQAFPNTVSDYFWSASPDADNSYFAWSVYFGHGYAGSVIRQAQYYVRLVRGGQSSAWQSARQARRLSMAFVAEPGSDFISAVLASLIGYDGTPPNAALNSVRSDASGRGAYFLSRATNLVPGVNNGAHHLFHFDAATGQLRNLGASTSGTPGDGDITAFDVALQAGKLVFRTKATNLESGPGLYLVDLHTGQREPLVTSGRGEKHDPEAERPAINAQGTWVAWDQPGAEGAWRVLGLEVADRSGQPPTLLNETAQVACCVRFDTEGRYLAWREAATDGRVVVSVLDYATGRHATVEWPAGVVPDPDTLRVEFAQGGRTLQWVRIGDVLQGGGAEAGSLLHQVNNPLFTPPERLQ